VEESLVTETRQAVTVTSKNYFGSKLLRSVVLEAGRRRRSLPAWCSVGGSTCSFWNVLCCDLLLLQYHLCHQETTKRGYAKCRDRCVIIWKEKVEVNDGYRSLSLIRSYRLSQSCTSHKPGAPATARRHASEGQLLWCGSRFCHH
jgi:hypothetical protein